MFALLGFFWAIAVIAHQGYGEIVRPTASVLLTLAAAAQFVRPSSLPLMLCVICGVFLDVALYLPFVTNHWVLFTFANLWLLLATALLALRARRLPTGGEVYALSAPGLRLLAILAYFFVTLAKVNSGFFDPQLGCAATMTGWIFGKLRLGTPPESLAIASAYATILIEGGIPVLLCLRRTRVFGLIVGTLFHVILGVNGFYNFSAVMLALYVPFLGDDFGTRLRAVVERVPQAAKTWQLWLKITHARVTLPLLLVAAILEAFVPSLLGMDLQQLGRIATYTYLLLWLDSASIFLTLLSMVWWFDRARLTHAQRIGLGHPLALVPVLLITLIGLCPYIGLKTEGSFTMFSNLRTEGEHWNHLFMPRGLRVFGFQDDLVNIIETDDPSLQRLPGQMTHWALRQHVTTRPEIALHYVHRGVEHRVTRAGDDRNLPKVDPVLHKLFWFRTVNVEHNECTH
jgi:hypothetical protein